MDFEGRTALITGSGAIGGLGHATARVLAAGGANVIITGTDPGRGAQVVDDVRHSAAGSAGTVRFIPADLADPQAVQRLAEDAGAVDVLINNAGVVPFSATADQDIADYDAAFAVNVRAPPPTRPRSPRGSPSPPATGPAT
ncbi:SDR family NAD(P)-dependent oxidoreductase [Actinomadura verrucosospora]|uniref:Short-chain dehydrogenase/reductase SDR n=1 Tax=Actinomadura verrucosospora TaxID=46165 RepID=A0A7D3ZWE9_ACTVE|nr:SDR family NAD(P)-dependent oxidoreductase [Actinomadura verrucosospora]QKG20024.1 short-chain dehydrogenase/reductase SDR [Actinomadura verrucosospora]